MKRLRSRQNRIDTLRTETRPRKRGRVGRYVYLAMLAALGLSLFDVLAGDLIYLRGEGMIAQEVAIVAPEFPGTVLSVDVEPGDQVLPGQTVAVMRSHQTLKDIAQLAAQVATVEGRLGELRIQQRKLESLIPEARKRVAAARTYRERIAQLQRSGLATGKEKAASVATAYGAIEELEKLEAESRLAASEYVQLKESAKRARYALTQIEEIYDGGVLSATGEGLVGTVLVSHGEGLKGGQRVVEIFHGPRHVLAYVPVGALYEIEPGDRVVVRFGLHTMTGRIESRLPLAYRLPQEFQRQFRTVERKQLIRVRLQEDITPPLFTEVEVTWPGALRVLFADSINFVGIGVRRARRAIAAGLPEAERALATALGTARDGLAAGFGAAQREIGALWRRHVTAQPAAPASAVPGPAPDQLEERLHGRAGRPDEFETYIEVIEAGQVERLNL